MMIGTPAVIRLVYYVVVLLYLACLAVHDIRTRRVPNKALLFYVILALPAPAILSAFSYAGLSSFPEQIIKSILGCAAGFLILLSGALLSKDGKGIGGGDIKLAALLGYIFGATEVTSIILIATLAATAYSFAIRLILKKTRSIPFVPFMLFGSLVIVITEIIVPL